MNKKYDKQCNNYLLYDFVAVTAAVPAYLLFRPKKWYENENAKQRIKGGALVIANHRGAIDPAAVISCIWYRRHHFLCKQQLFENPASSWLFRQFHCIPVDRDNCQMESLRRAVECLKAGKVVSVFPEGHRVRNEDEKADAFKSGVVLMSVMSKKPIVPVYIVPRRRFYNRMNFVIGESVDITEKYGPMPNLKQIEEITMELRERENRLKAIYEERRKHG